MNRGRGRSPGSSSGPRGWSAISSNNHRLGGRGTKLHQNSQSSCSRGSNNGTPSGYRYQPKKVLGDEISASKSSDAQVDVTKSRMAQTPGEGARSEAALHADQSLQVTIANQQKESSLNWQSGAEGNQTSKEEHHDNSKHIGDSEHLEQLSLVQPFDICLDVTGTPVMLKPSLLVKNKERRNEIKRANQGLIGEVLGSGIVLLKNYLTIQDQVKIVKKCRDLGLGPGGFYQPGYHDGGRLRLKMMCLGKNWDPDRSMYLERRPVDDTEPPSLPREFYLLVEKAIKDAHGLIERDCKVSHVEEILPRMSPNLCIVNFYSESGRLGLHQDKDESQESLRKGLPVVSFSIGDAGEFLYADHRDADKPKEIKLESGDVLIFGGKSRHIFHGVSSILPKTAPQSLLEESNLRPGRLNLTFREY